MTQNVHAVNHRDICSACHQRMPVEFKHRLTKLLVNGLVKLGQANGPTKRHALGLTPPEWVNLQKLRYFGLAENPKRGTWVISKFGRDFLAGTARAPRAVWTLLGEVTKVDTVTVHITDTMPATQTEYT